MVCLVDHYDFEPLLCRQIYLLGLCNFLEQLLYDISIVVSNVRWRYLQMVDRGDNVEFELAIGRGLEDSCVDFDLFDAGTVKFAEGCNDTSLLACSRWTVDK